MLCGRFPFWGKTDIEYMRSLNRGPCLEGEVWDEVTDDGKAFVRAMLHLDPKKRLTAVEALRHAWIGADMPRKGYSMLSADGHGSSSTEGTSSVDEAEFHDALSEPMHESMQGDDGTLRKQENRRLRIE